MSESGICLLKGEINNIPRTKRYQKDKWFNVMSEASGVTFKCYYNFFCWPMKGDYVHGYGTLVGNEFRFTRLPFIFPGTDIETIKGCLTSAFWGLRVYPKTINDFINELGSNPAEFLDEAISDFTKYPSENVRLLSPNINETQMKSLYRWWYKRRLLRKLYLLGLNNAEIRGSELSAYELYKACLDITTSSPYRLMSLKLKTCDEIYERLNAPVPQDERVNGSVMRKIAEYTEQGWGGIPMSLAYTKIPNLATILPVLIENFGAKVEYDTLYPGHIYSMECAVAKYVYDVCHREPLPTMDESILDKVFDDRLTEQQLEAVKYALTHNLSIITGNAGSGKTTIIKEMVCRLESAGQKYLVVSFTGKAVARLRQVLGRRNPHTMHKMIAEESMAKDEKGYKPKDIHHLIIDEASMITTELFYEFFEMFPTHYRITLIGDPNQLLPIGWGTLMEQLMKCNFVPQFKLTEVHRVQRESGILRNAYRLINYQAPEDEEDHDHEPFEFVDTGDFQIFEGDEEALLERMIRLFHDGKILAKDFVVVTPYKALIRKINLMCQQIYDHGEFSIVDTTGNRWKINDKVMMRKNNYAIDVMNGEEGTVVNILHDEAKILVNFGDEKTVEFITDFENNSLNTRGSDDQDQDEKELNAALEAEEALSVRWLCLSYGITCHKSQGSEWQFEIFYIPPGKIMSRFLDRNLVYTAITRASKALVCLGDIRSLNVAAVRKPMETHDNLHRRIMEHTISPKENTDSEEEGPSGE